MAISRKPKEENPPDVDVDALILRGGSVASSEVKIGPKAKDPTPVVLRIPTALLERIDDALEARSVKIPRHTWLLEAVVEKLDRERG
jgi:hypothetical protein